ncbi:efflux RND transporter permease subunit [Frateuria aurantia]
MNIFAFFIRRPIGTSLLAAGIFVAGAICYAMLGVAALPDMEFPAIFVQASEQGADASTMASTVTAPLERHLAQIPGIDSMRSSSSENSSQVFLMFNIGTNVDAAARQVQAAVNASMSDLPSGLNSPPSYEKANPNDDPIIAFALTSTTQSARALYDVADSILAQRLRQVVGVSEVDISGAATPAVRIDLDTQAINSMGLMADQIRNTVRAANVVSPVGFISNGKTQTALQDNDALNKAEDFGDLVISTENTVPVKLSDVAHVYEGTEDANQAAWFGTQHAIIMYVYKQSNANVIATVDKIRALVPELNTYLQPGTRLTPYFDGTPTIRSSLREVQLTLLISLALVVLTMAIFLRRAAPTLIATVAVPLALAGAIVVMYAFGYTLNNLTLLALVIAIGFVVDDAIVVIENIIRHVDQGVPRLQAALTGTREIGFTIVAITASLVAVFIPLLFAGGVVGMFFNAFSVTLIAAILMSAAVSLTLTPSMCGLFLKPELEQQPTSWLGQRLEAGHAAMLRWYAAALDFSLRHARSFAVTPLLMIGLTLFIAGHINSSLFPEQDTGLIRGRAMASSTVSFAESSRRLNRIIDMLLADPAVAEVGARLGSSRQGTSASFDIQLKSHAEGRRESTSDALARLSLKAERYPDLSLRLRPIQDLPSGGGGGTSQGGQYQIALQGDNSDELQQWLPKLQDALKSSPLLRDVGTDVDTAGLRQNIIINRDLASRLGIDIGDIDNELDDAFGQRSIGYIYAQLNQYQVVLNAVPSLIATPGALDHINVATSSGAMVPISTVAHQVPGLAPTQITHEDQQTTMNLSFNLAPGVSMGEALALVQATARNMRMPGDIKLNVGGDFRRFQQSMNGMLWLVFGAIATVYIVLGMLYESLIHPVTILSTLPAAGVGALLALWLTHTDLSVIAQIALVLLIGIIKKNAIMMIDFALVVQREQGLTALQAAREASLVRFRPIMMTTMVALLGAVPLVIGLGQGSELRRPLGIAMVGGLLISQSLTLLSTPALYVVFSRASERVRARFGRRRAAGLNRPAVDAG